MDAGALDWVLRPVVQHGFLGLCAVQLAVGVWLVRRLLEAVAAMTSALTAHAEAARQLAGRQEEAIRQLTDLRERLRERPCLAGRRRGA